MEHDGRWDLELDSEPFKVICQFLNRTIPTTDATLHYDVMSGGYRFSDESPADSVRNLDEALILPLITLLRCLWAYRLSVVRGTPRVELAEWWNSARSLAPNWCGFLPDRCREGERQFAQFCDARQTEWEAGVEALERRLADAKRDTLTGGLEDAVN